MMTSASMTSGVSRVKRALCMAPLLLAAHAALAQSWPSKPLRWVVPFAPGGGLDIITQIGRAHV